ncbi:hypothetical protein NMG60_11025326 [Bertholletia excelsa]
MGSRKKALFKLAYLLIGAFLCLLPTVIKAQMQGCSIEGLDLYQCLNGDKNSISSQSCCLALNKVAQAGFHCVCLFLASSVLPTSTFPLLPFSNCYISVPPLAQCRDVSSVPGLQPPPGPGLPVVLPPNIPEEPRQSPASNSFFIPPPPEEAYFPVTAWPPPNTAPDLSIPGGRHVIPNGQETRSSSQPILLLALLLHAFRDINKFQP